MNSHNGPHTTDHCLPVPFEGMQPLGQVFNFFRKCINGTFQCMQFLLFFIIFFTCLSRPSLIFTSMTPNQDQKTYILQLSACPSPITLRHSRAPQRSLLYMLLVSAHKKYPAQTVVHFDSLELGIPMIQVPFNSSCAALQYGNGTKFSSCPPLPRNLCFSALMSVDFHNGIGTPVRLLFIL